MLKIKKLIAVCCFISLSMLNLYAQKQVQGIITGFIFEKSSGQPLEFTQVTLKKVADSTDIQGTVANSKGEFRFEKVPAGEYRIVYSFIGFGTTETPVLTISASQNKLNLGKLYISETAETLSEVEVTGRKSTFVNSIDRKTFNVGEDLMSKTGSLSDLLQNVPSLQVDIDGNVSLRGSENVTILINGKPSAMMNLNRAAALQQMQANSIEKIEVITNPSAKYKPDGTSGIINIVLKKNTSLGLNGNVIANAGNENRYNSNVSLNYNPGKLNVFGSAGIRQDDRRRINDITTQTFLNGNQTSLVHNYSENHARPINYIANLGADYKLNERYRFGLSANYNYRYQRQNDSSVYTNDSISLRKEDYNRNRYLPELETDLELTSFIQHNFGKEGHEVNLNYTSSFTKENEDNYYSNIYRLPVPRFNFDNMFYHHTNNVSQFLAEYSNPLSESSKLEAGYELDKTNNDMDLHRDTTAMNQSVFIKDNSRSSRFIRSETTQVLYLTYERESGKFGFLVGLRGENTSTRADLATKNSVISNHYNRLYPSLHTSYKITDNHELQVNYSHRIRRPEDEQLNPFPEYQDMRNIRAGNPYLKPEDIHSFEFGYQYKKNATTFISTAYCRFNNNGITSITKTSGDTLISTLKNLSNSTSAGLELILSTSLGKIVTINLSSNTFYNTIDASALGYSKNKSAISLSANANLGINLTKSTVWQLSSNYTGEQLTPQGKRLSSYVLNTGLKQELFKKKAALILTVSDVLNSLRYKSIIDTPDLQRFENRKRSDRIIYCGFTYSFGNSGQKQKENTLKYDNQL
jgi:outer membrane receptor protein involved in Fe transport